MRTRYAATKVSADVRAAVGGESFLSRGVLRSERLRGYEIHMGEVQRIGPGDAPFTLLERNTRAVEMAEGALSEDGTVVGTSLHGILDNASVRASLLATLGVGEAAQANAATTQDHELDRLADAVGAALDMDAISRAARIALPLSPGE